jgi:hypothetical protein
LLYLERRIFNGQHLRADSLELRVQIFDAPSVEIRVPCRAELIAAHALGLAEDLVELLFVLGDQSVEIALGLLEPAFGVCRKGPRANVDGDGVGLAGYRLRSTSAHCVSISPFR